MDEKSIEILNNAYNLIIQANSLEENEREKFINDNLNFLVNFYYQLKVYGRMILYKDNTDKEQAILSDKFFEVVKWISINSELFEKFEKEIGVDMPNGELSEDLEKSKNGGDSDHDEFGQ